MSAFQSIILRTAFGLVLTVALAGCASTVVAPDTAASHPANARSAASPVPPLQPDLLSITNMVMVKPVSKPAPEHQHGHEKHEAKPNPGEKK